MSVSASSDFLELDDIPGHSLRRLSEIPESERQSYIQDQHLSNRADNHLVWYPKVPKDDWERVHKVTRKKLLEKIERVFGVSMADYPREEELFVWKVARYVRRKAHLS